MTPDELNITYECLMMIDTSLELIVRRAKEIQEACMDRNITFTDLQANGLRRVQAILNMVDSIERRKGPLFKLIEEQRKSHG